MKYVVDQSIVDKIHEYYRKRLGVGSCSWNENKYVPKKQTK